jgi:N-acetylglucosaminyldiphosphoundecaprenol N-acetyl-beta-D-mannosaminyltransferase
MKFIEVMGFKVFSDDLLKIPLEGKCRLVNTISPNSYGISTKDVLFRQALRDTEYLVLDGVYFALSSMLLHRRNIKKNQGPDVFFSFMDMLNARGGKAFFMGASQKTLEQIKQRAAHDYPRIQVDTLSPPYKPQFTDAENFEIINRINAFKPDILFVGMTAPKQEKWAYQHKAQLQTKLAVSIGGVFDWYAGNEKSIAPIWWKLRLAWLIRTIQRPEILKRYPNIFIFFEHLILALIGIKKYKYGRF